MCTAENPAEFSALSASSGKRACSSTSAAYGAIWVSHRSRSTERSSSCSSGSLNASNDGLPPHVDMNSPSLTYELRMSLDRVEIFVKSVGSPVRDVMSTALGGLHPIQEMRHHRGGEVAVR